MSQKLLIKNIVSVHRAEVSKKEFRKLSDIRKVRWYRQDNKIQFKGFWDEIILELDQEATAQFESLFGSYEEYCNPSEAYGPDTILNMTQHEAEEIINKLK